MAIFRLGDWDRSGETGIAAWEREAVCYPLNRPQFAKAAGTTQAGKSMMNQHD
jgi:hypothetical protein